MSNPTTPSPPGRRRPPSANQRPTIDTADFCRRGLSVDGVQPVARLPRLLENLFDDDGEVAWTVSGRREPRAEGGSDQWLSLHLQARVAATCDRCLQRIEIEFGGDRDYLLLATEQQAASVDADVDEYDVLVADAHFDLLGLVEDEAIMMQPISVQHEDCDLPVELEEDELEAPPNPFAALAALRKPGGDEGSGGQGGSQH